MNTMRSAALRSGDPLKIGVRVAELLLAQLAIMCAPRSDQREKDAVFRPKVVLQSLDAVQRGQARTVRKTSARLSGKYAPVAPPHPAEFFFAAPEHIC